MGKFEYYYGSNMDTELQMYELTQDSLVFASGSVIAVETRANSIGVVTDTTT
jgi:hypothetical protein